MINGSKMSHPLIVPLTMGQDSKHISLWGPYLFKPQHMLKYHFLKPSDFKNIISYLVIQETTGLQSPGRSSTKSYEDCWQQL